MSGIQHLQVQLDGYSLEVTSGGPPDSGLPTIGAAHPAGVFGEGPALLLSEAARPRVVCVNVRGLGTSSPPPAGQPYTLTHMVDDIERVRLRLGGGRWVFWGMSGGGWLGQIYAHAYPQSLSGLILESVCACFRLRLADPECVLSPLYPSWRDALGERGLLAPGAHAAVGDPHDIEPLEIANVGTVFRRRNGPALLVSPMPVTPEMRAATPLLWTVDTRTLLPQLRTPTLVIAGDSDPIVPVAHARALHEAIRGSEFYLVKGGGHAPVTQKRPEFAGAVQRFLRSLPQ